MFEHFAATARNTVTEGVREATRRGDRRVGTQHLLVGLLHDRESALALGADLDGARAAEEALDHEALAAVGVDPGPGPLEVPGAPWALRMGRLPLTSGAKDVLSRSLRYASSERSRSITGRHLLLALLDNPSPDPAAVLLTRIGVDPAEVRRRLRS